eukprot:9485663-Pyramimonas_sp.AAC.1
MSQARVPIMFDIGSRGHQSMLCYAMGCNRSVGLQGDVSRMVSYALDCNRSVDLQGHPPMCRPYDRNCLDCSTVSVQTSLIPPPTLADDEAQELLPFPSRVEHSSAATVCTCSAHRLSSPHFPPPSFSSLLPSPPLRSQSSGPNIHSCSLFFSPPSLSTGPEHLRAVQNIDSCRTTDYSAFTACGSPHAH